MLFINPMMIEPTTASLAIYIASSTPHFLKNNRIAIKKPHIIKKRVCKWVKKNKHSLIDISIEEGVELIFDNINYIAHYNPSIFILTYLFILLIIILL